MSCGSSAVRLASTRPWAASTALLAPDEHAPAEHPDSATAMKATDAVRARRDVFTSENISPCGRDNPGMTKRIGVPPVGFEPTL